MFKDSPYPYNMIFLFFDNLKSFAVKLKKSAAKNCREKRILSSTAKLKCCEN